MKNIFFTLENLLNNKKYNEIIELIDGYVKEGFGVDNIIIDYYLTALNLLRRYDDAYEFIKKYEKVAINVSPEVFARWYYFCYRSDEAERILNSCKMQFNETLLPVKIYLRLGKVEKAKELLEEILKIPGSEKIKGINKIRGAITSYYKCGAFIETEYDSFVKNGNRLEPGHIIFIKKMPDYTRPEDNEPNASYRPYMIWKIENDRIYMFPVSSQTRLGYKLYGQNYPNSVGDRVVKRYLCETTIDNVLSVQDKVTEYDYKLTIKNIFIATYYGGPEEIRKNIKFMREYAEKPNIHDVIITIDAEQGIKKHRYYLVLDENKEGYSVAEFDIDKVELINSKPELFSKDRIIYRVIHPSDEHKLELLSQLKNENDENTAEQKKSIKERIRSFFADLKKD